MTTPKTRRSLGGAWRRLEVGVPAVAAIVLAFSATVFAWTALAEDGCPGVTAPAGEPAPPNDPLFAEQWSLRNLGAGPRHPVHGCPVVDADIDAPEAWEKAKGAGTVVALIDTGVDVEHPDLDASIWTNPGESGNGRESNGLDDDRNGYVDDVHGYDFFLDGNDISDPYPHGTLSAGVIAAEADNGLGIAGIAPDAEIMVLKSFAEPSGPVDFVPLLTRANLATAAAIDYAVANGADVISASWAVLFPGGPGDATVIAAINRASAQGLSLVFAAGNFESPTFPQSAPAPGTIIVTASNRWDRFGWDYPGYGPHDCEGDRVRRLQRLAGTPAAFTLEGGMYTLQLLVRDVIPAPVRDAVHNQEELPEAVRDPFAPPEPPPRGTPVFSECPWGEPAFVDLAAPTGVPAPALDGGYTSFGGTSASTPHVAGAVALLRSRHPSLDPIEVKCLMKRSVDPGQDLGDYSSSGGRLNARAVLDAADDYVRDRLARPCLPDP